MPFKMVITWYWTLVPWELKENESSEQDMKMSPFVFYFFPFGSFFCWLNSKRKQQHNLELLLLNAPTASLIWYHSVYKAKFASVIPSCIPNKKLYLWRQIPTKVNLRENNFLSSFYFPSHSISLIRNYHLTRLHRFITLDDWTSLSLFKDFCQVIFWGNSVLCMGEVP